MPPNHAKRALPPIRPPAIRGKVGFYLETTPFVLASLGDLVYVAAYTSLSSGRRAPSTHLAEARGLMDDQATGAPQVPSADTGGPRHAEYDSPELPAGAVHACSSAPHWAGAHGALGDDHARKRARMGEEAPLHESLTLHQNAQVTPTQREVLHKILKTLDPEQSSVVITNPLLRDNPIVYVTKPWENMCGFSYDQAVGRNPRVTQGERSDPETVRCVSGALAQQRACKVMMLNYRGGLTDRPFWNMLSISPITHNGQLQLYLANLQDYTYHMSRLVSTPPTQFCRSAEHHQSARVLPENALRFRYYARPGVLEAGDDAAGLVRQQQQQQQQGLTQPGGGAGGLAAPQMHMKRLGWSKLSLEPEHLTDRVVDALHSLDARYERAEATAESDDVFVVNAEISGVACRVLVTRDPNDDEAYRISCTRLGGDTFAYHDIFRQLREKLGDAVQGGVSMHGSGGGGVRRPALMSLGLAPMRRAAVTEVPTASSSLDPAKDGRPA